MKPSTSAHALADVSSSAGIQSTSVRIFATEDHAEAAERQCSRRLHVTVDAQFSIHHSPAARSHRLVHTSVRDQRLVATHRHNITATATRRAVRNAHISCRRNACAARRCSRTSLVGLSPSLVVKSAGSALSAAFTSARGAATAQENVKTPS